MKNDFNAAAIFKWGAFALLFWLVVGFMLITSKGNAQCGVNAFTKQLVVKQSEWGGLDDQLQLIRITYVRDSVSFESPAYNIQGKITQVSVNCHDGLRHLTFNQGKSVFNFTFDKTGLRSFNLYALELGIANFNR